jgi:class 3 adenylate cyclase
MAGCPACGTELPTGEFPFCPWCAAPLAAPAAGQRKTVSVVFCDLVDSTALGARVDPEVLRGLLADYWTRARAVIVAHGGVVEKFIGDAVVGVFGLRVLHEDDALRAVRSAADLLASVRELNKTLAGRLDVELTVRVGVNTGEVLADARSETLISGDTANVAARLQTAAAPGQVLLSASTYQLVRDAVAVTDVGPLQVKGKGEPLPAFSLLGVRPASAGQVRRRRFSTRVIGRGRQLALAEAMYATAVEERTCVLLTVLGEPGVGKSRLVDEVLARIGEEATVLIGRCLPYGEGITYAPLAQMLLMLADHVGGSTSDLVSGIEHPEAIAAGLETLAGRAQTATAAEMAWAFRRLAESLGRERPLVLVVDDLQWGQPGLLELLADLVELARGAAILVVATARPDLLAQQPTWGSGRLSSTTITLPSLSATDSERLTTELLGPQADPDLVARITEAAGGIPLFVEETVAMLVDEGRLVADASGGFRAIAGLDGLTVPPTVRAILAARLDQLPGEQREVVDAACVVGKTFYPEALQTFLGPDLDVPGLIDELVRSDLVTPARSDLAGYDAFGFTHLLTAETAYLALPKRRRAQLHEQTAQWLRGHSTDSTTRAVVAFHLEQVVGYRVELGEPDPELAQRTVQVLLELVDESTAIGDGAAAAAYADRAVQLTTTPSEVGVLAQLARSRASRVAGSLADASMWAASAEEQARLLGNSTLRIRSTIQRTFVDDFIDQTNSAATSMRIAQECLEVLSGSGDDAALADAYRLRATASSWLGQVDAASRDALAALEHARRSPRTARRYGDLLTLVMAPMEVGGGTLDEGVELLDFLEREYGDDQAMRADINSERLWVVAFRGDLDGAQVELQRRCDLMIEQGSVLWAASWLWYGVGMFQEWRGELDSAVTTLRRAIDLKEAGGDTASRSTMLGDLARLLGTIGRIDEAKQALASSRALSQEQDAVNEILWGTAEGMIAACDGDVAASEGWFEQTLTGATPTQFVPAMADFWGGWSVAREVGGDVEGALAAARQAFTLWQRKQFVPPMNYWLGRVDELSK